MKYVTSDLHFRHKNILKLQPKTRPWGSMEQMEDALIEQINGLQNCEMLYHLGDFFFGNKNKLHQVLDRIKVPMTFIRGNHDGSTWKLLREFSEGRAYDYKEIRENHRKIVMFHYPIYMDWNNSHHGSIHFHGHLHGRGNGQIPGKCIDVGWDSYGRILALDEAIMLADAKPKETFH